MIIYKTLHILASDPEIANQLAAALSGNPADAQTFTDEGAVLFTKDGTTWYGREIACPVEHYEKALSFADGGNPFNLHPDTNDENRATMEIRAGDMSIRGTLRTWAASLGYEVAIND